MKKLSFLLPEEFSIVPATAYNDGETAVVSGDGGSELVVMKQGEILQETGQLSILTKTSKNNFPGGRLARLSPRDILPRQAFEPFKCAFSFEEEPGLNDWYGLTEKGVRQFRRVDFQDGTVPAQFKGESYKNPRLFSFGGDLFFLCEGAIAIGDSISQSIKLFKYFPDLSRFDLVHVFQERVTIDPSTDLYVQTGSPDWFEHNGKLHIGYRVFNRNQNKNKIVVYRQSDIGAWTKVTDFFIEGSLKSPVLSRVRVRFASSGDTVMCVFYGISSFSDNFRSNVEQHDMRSFVSSDGINFKSKTTRFSNAAFDDDGAVTSVRSATNMAYMFIPVFDTDINTSYRGLNEKFSLHFDKNMASYVIFKGGDTKATGGSNTLVGVKTADNDFSFWETCALYELNPNNNGLIPDEPGVQFQFPTIPYNVPPERYSLHIDDVDAMWGATSTMALVVKEYDESGELLRIGSAMMDFCFVSDEQIGSGSAPRIYRWGGKSHPEWGFAARPVCPDSTGTICGGSYQTQGQIDAFQGAIGWSPATGLTHGSYIAIGKWRSQVVTVEKLNQRFRTLTLFDQWSNFAETVPYQFAYSAAIAPVTKYPFVSQAGGATYSEVTMNYSCSPGQFLRILNSQTGATPELFEKNDFNPKFSMFFKVRATLRISSVGVDPVGLIDFIVKNSDGDGYHIVAAVTEDSVQIWSDEGDGLEMAESFPAEFDWTSHFEICIGLGRGRENQLKSEAYVMFRPRHSSTWQLGGKVLLDGHDDLLPMRCRVGSVLNHGNVFVHDFQASAGDRGSKVVFSDHQGAYALREMGHDVALAPGDHLNPYHNAYLNSSDEPVTLMDGSVVRIIGSETKGAETFRIQQSRALNSTNNLLDGISDRMFDFTTIIPKKDIGEDYCQCQKASASVLNDEHGQLVVLEKIPSKMDSFSLVNVFGIHCFDFIVGEFSNGEWQVGSEVFNYEVTKISLTLKTAPFGDYIAVGEIFEQSQLIGANILKYNTVLGTYIDSFKVTKNYHEVIVLNRNVGSIDNSELHLVMPSSTYTLSETAAELVAESQNVGLRFYGVSNAELMGVGQVLLGKLCDVSPYVNKMQVTWSDSAQTVRSDFGFHFNSTNRETRVIETISLEMSSKDGDIWLNGLLADIAKKEQPFVVVEEQSDGKLLTHMTHLGEVSYNAINYFQTYTAQLEVQKYKAAPTRRVVYKPPSVNIIGNIVAPVFTAIELTGVAVDPEGGDLLYEWSGTYDSLTGVGDDEFSYLLPPDVQTDRVTLKVTSSVSGLSAIATIQVYQVSVVLPTSLALEFEENPELGVWTYAELLIKTTEYYDEEIEENTEVYPDISPLYFNASITFDPPVVDVRLLDSALIHPDPENFQISRGGHELELRVRGYGGNIPLIKGKIEDVFGNIFEFELSPLTMPTNITQAFESTTGINDAGPHWVNPPVDSLVMDWYPLFASNHPDSTMSDQSYISEHARFYFTIFDPETSEEVVVPGQLASLRLRAPSSGEAPLIKVISDRLSIEFDGSNDMLSTEGLRPRFGPAKTICAVFSIASGGDTIQAIVNMDDESTPGDGSPRLGRLQRNGSNVVQMSVPDQSMTYKTAANSSGSETVDRLIIAKIDTGTEKLRVLNDGNDAGTKDTLASVFSGDAEFSVGASLVPAFRQYSRLRLRALYFFADENIDAGTVNDLIEYCSIKWGTPS